MLAFAPVESSCMSDYADGSFFDFFAANVNFLCVSYLHSSGRSS